MNRSMALFFYLQILDLLTTLAGLPLGREVGLGINFLSHLGVGTLNALLIVKALSLTAGAACATMGFAALLRALNLGFAVVVVWNLALIVLH